MNTAGRRPPKSRRVPEELRQRTERSCDRCKTRKQKCSLIPGQSRCRHCLKHGYECLVTKPRKRRMYGNAEAYAMRVALLENLVRGLVPGTDVSSLESLQAVERSLDQAGRLAPKSREAESAVVKQETELAQVAQQLLGSAATATATATAPAPAPSPTTQPLMGPAEVKEEHDAPGPREPPFLEEEHLVTDLQGQTQFIGRSSSFFFQLRLRAMVATGRHRRPRGSLGGPEAGGRSSATPATAAAVAETPLVPDLQSMANGSSSSVTANVPCPLSVAELIEDGPVEPEEVASSVSLVYSLVRIYFEQINCEFPVLHEATFVEQLSSWCCHPGEADPVWLCSLLCVLLLSRRLFVESRSPDAREKPSPGQPDALPSSLSQYQEERWWQQAQTLLSRVLCTSSLGSVQALSLAALHLHNTLARDVCWTLTGAAVRIGYAIGLHRDSTRLATVGGQGLTQHTREMRRRVWWTLYAFEQLQVSSHDRPTALDSDYDVAPPSRLPATTTAHPLGNRHETVEDGTCGLPEFSAFSNRLAVILGAASRAVRRATSLAASSGSAAAVLRDLSQWRADLPQQLSLEAINSMSPTFCRSLLLLHIQYHYIAALVTRSALLARFKAGGRDSQEAQETHMQAPDTPGNAGRSMADLCVESGRVSCQLVLKLNNLGCFNAHWWTDVYYLYSSALVLVLGIICGGDGSEGHADVASLRQLLDVCNNLATKHLGNELLPGTMRRWLSVTNELHTMVADCTDEMGGKFSKREMLESESESQPQPEPQPQQPQPQQPQQPQQQQQQQPQPPQQQPQPPPPPPPPHHPLPLQISLQPPPPQPSPFHEQAYLQPQLPPSQPQMVSLLPSEYAPAALPMLPSASDPETARSSFSFVGGDLAQLPTASAVSLPTTDVFVDPGVYGYGVIPVTTAVAPTDPRVWQQQMHWDGISDMLLGLEPRPWNMNMQK